MGDLMRSGEKTIVKSQSSARRLSGGFAYMLLLVAVAIVAVGGAAALQLGASVARRDAEQALLLTGYEFERALRGYAGLATNVRPPLALAVYPGVPGPRSLDELLKDTRVPGIRRYLRRIYDDPLTGKSQWGVIRDPEGFIVGVYSLADGVPIKQDGFEIDHAHFARASSYSAWVFGLPGVHLLKKPS